MAPVLDYYAVLQVHPSADQEVIDAAYRQLMKKYHPDRAGSDPRSVAAFHERAKVINEAYAVLRDPGRRRAYDLQRFGVPGTPMVDPVSARPAASSAPGSTTWATPDPTTIYTPQPPDAERESSGILGALAAAYSLLPGAYEWERGYARDALALLLVPPVGLLAWALASGRMTRLLGDAPLAPAVAWLLVTAMALPLVRIAPRLLIAAGPSLLLVSGMFNGQLTEARVPLWLAWFIAGLFGLTLAARVYLFAVLPTLGIYLLLTRIT